MNYPLKQLFGPVINRLLSLTPVGSKEYRRSSAARFWSNQQLKKFGSLFTGSVINVSGWCDQDKQGGHYRDYFPNCKNYFITNYLGYSGYQGRDRNEIFLDLEKKIPPKLRGKFSVVYNHTTLEHIYHCEAAFKNLCALSKDILIVVVPFLQELHFAPDKSYLDYWRFTPYTLARLFEENGLKLCYLSANNKKNEFIYLFAIGTKNYQKWEKKLPRQDPNLFKKLGNMAVSYVSF